jgi:hypothetical protein
MERKLLKYFLKLSIIFEACLSTFLSVIHTKLKRGGEILGWD